jgi:hypothetical protein
MSMLHSVTESTPFVIVDMLFHIWLIGHLVHHVVHLVPKGHRHIQRELDWHRWRLSVARRDLRARKVRRLNGSIA